MDYRDKNFDEYENYYELEIDNFDELHKELETAIFKNIFIEPRVGSYVSKRLFL